MLLYPLRLSMVLACQHDVSYNTVTSKGLTTVRMATRAHTGPPKPEDAFPAKEVLGAAEATEHNKEYKQNEGTYTCGPSPSNLCGSTLRLGGSATCWHHTSARRVVVLLPSHSFTEVSASYTSSRS